MTRILYVLLAVVAAAAAVLSFDALVGLALLCGFTPILAWLLPLTIDAGAAAGSLAWLGRPPGAARRFGRTLALTLLGGSVAGNALSHGLGAYSLTPAWWVVVAVSAVPPAVLGAVVHLAVLAGRPEATLRDAPNRVTRSESGLSPTGSETSPTTLRAPAKSQSGDLDPATVGLSPMVAEGDATFPAPGSTVREGVQDPHAPGLDRSEGGAEGADSIRTPDLNQAEAGADRAGKLIAAGAGRRRLARELDISEHAARELLAERRNGHQVMSS